MARTRSPPGQSKAAAAAKKKDAEHDAENEQPPTAEEQQRIKDRLNIKNEEVEVKLRIPDSASFAAAYNSKFNSSAEMTKEVPAPP